MSKQYEVRVCSCGRIHVLPWEAIEFAIYDGSEFTYICGGCGAAVSIGADETVDFDDPDTPAYDMYSRGYDGEGGMFNEIFQNTCDLYYSPGVKVPMMTGNYANSYCDGFKDMVYPDLYKIDRDNVTAEEVHEFIADYNKKSITVNMGRLMREQPKEIVQAISDVYFEQFDWSGTQYDRQAH